jgi:mannose-1-phosphate guanylyltransferase
MLHAVLMVGGAGTRFWPLSRKKSPKYLLPIVGKKSMLLQTVERIEPMIPPERIYCITSKDQAAGIRKALPQLPKANVIGEPMGRDSAACVALAAMIIHNSDPDAVMLCMPGDNLVKQSGKFRKVVRAAAQAAEAGSLVTFGIKPAAPETRFGYIHRGSRLTRCKGSKVFKVKRFTEKPDLKTAKRMLKTGQYYWNSGNFVWRADVILDQFAQHAPTLHAAVERIRPALGTRREAAAIKREYQKLEKISIDYAVMEKAADVAVVEAEFDWDDVGSWTALERHYPQDKAGNTLLGKTLMLGDSNCVVSTDDGHLVAAVGMDNVIIVHTPDATLVCPKDKANDVKSVVQELERLKQNGYL